MTVDRSRLWQSDSILAVCSLALGLFSTATLIAIGYLNYTTLPWFDAWEHWIQYLGVNSPIAFLFSQHNEHRIPVSRILYFADQTFFGADTRLLLWCSFLAQAGSALVLYRLACSSGRLSASIRATVFGIILAFAFSASQLINFTWAFCVCFVVVFFAAFAAFAALERGRTTLSIAMAMISTGSMANGLLVWPLLVTLAVCIKLSKRTVAVLALTGIAVTAAYMHGYVRSGVTLFSTSSPLLKTPDLMVFALAYLGSAFDQPLMAIAQAAGLHWEIYRIPLSALAGLAGCIWFLRLVGFATPNRSAASPASFALFHIVGFVVASAVLTAVGRVQMLPMIEALTPRYTTPSLLFWAALFAIGLPAARGYRPRVAALVAAAIVGGLIQLPKVTYAAETERYLSESEYAFINDVFVPEAWIRFTGTTAPARTIPVVRFFRANHLATFSRAWTLWIGEPVRAHFLVSSSDADCLGAWESVAAAGGSFNPAALVQGWAYNRRSKRPPDRLVFTDGGGRIAGYATPTRHRPDVIAARPQISNDRVGWASYLAAGTPSDLSAYILLEDGRTLCRIGGGRIPGNFVTAPAAKAAEAIAGVDVRADSGWIRNLEPRPGPPPPFVTDTWNTRPNTIAGSLRLGPVSAPSGSTIGLPLSTGARLGGVRVAAVDRRAGQIISVANPPAGLPAWALWRIDIPAGAPDMVIDYVVESNGGGGEGDWISVGTPRRINP